MAGSKTLMSSASRGSAWVRSSLRRFALTRNTRKRCALPRSAPSRFASWRSTALGDGTGKATRRNRSRFRRIGGGYKASMPRVYCGDAASWWNAASRTVTKPAACGGCQLRGRGNILKRQLVQVSAFNLSLILRQLLGAGTPRELRNRATN
jgi:hypothetical protein